jgi:hypothetical protein
MGHSIHMELSVVNLGKGLEEIGMQAFRGCRLLRDIVIPPHLLIAP